MNGLTQVEITFLPEVVNDWLRFGEPVSETVLTRRRSHAFFAPGNVFGYVRWRQGDYGTALWQLFVLRAVRIDQPATRLPGIEPGADLFAAFEGKAKVQRALDLLDDLERRSLDPAQVSPAWWRVAGNRIATGLPVRPYSENQHAALEKLRQLRP
ncbi:DUF2840 domain-containing protein [uncultured Erythrobacter sp.]|uniref:DUF2840 domain-containing protein n=1 Tax=uncultured Erythrobacter sp. TaxID=263913 RepID=UPI002628CC9F|nr:DUF2840 domain-containing protein [uncultured Erythrobacter sp.]